MKRALSVFLACACLTCSSAFAATYTNHGTNPVLTDTSLGGNSTGTSTYYNGGDSTKEDGSTTFTGAAINIGDATHTATFTLVDGNSHLNSYGGNAITINAGSTLALKTNKVPDTDWGVGYTWPTASTANFLNWMGDVTWAGKIQFQPRNLTWSSINPDHVGNNPNITLLDNYGTIQITGQNAVIERLPNPDGNTFYGTEVGAFMNWGATGRLIGNGRLTYQNSTGSAAMNTLEMSNYGTIAPGTASAPGTLELANMNLWTGNSGKMEFRLGGTAAGTFDVLKLTGGALESGWPTSIPLVNGFVPQHGDQWQIMDYGSTQCTGIYNLGGGYSLEFFPTYATLTYVPEPASLTLLALGGLALCHRRRQPALITQSGFCTHN